ncbi:MAG: uroporphyrinogen decarboxylase [Planctomycetia bacterium]|nr:uroporphyrinogen decarboxylase [Planctomycetia bacterium]
MKTAACWNSRMMKALRREPVDVPPVWMMRQAGRYMAEYREVREQTTFLELCKNPDRCAEVMLTAVEKLDVDAAIIFSDLLLILEAMGMELEFSQGEGPVFHNPVSDASQVDNLRELDDPSVLGYVYETVRKTRAGLHSERPLIGFAGAPFTLASYAIEGGASRNYLRTKKLMYTDPVAWDTVMGRLARGVSAYLIEQIRAGADILQLFDSWVGCLGVYDYERFVLPYSRQIINAVKRFSPDTPVIHFATGNPALLRSIRNAGGDCIGIDWRIELDVAWDAVGHDRSIQGNLDPAILLTDPLTIREQVARLRKQVAHRPGFVFNLGHGIHKETPVENARELVKWVRELV